MAPHQPPPPPLRLWLLGVLAAVGTCMIAAEFMASGLLGWAGNWAGGWPFAGVGVLALLGSLAGLWRVERERNIG